MGGSEGRYLVFGRDFCLSRTHEVTMLAMRDNYESLLERDGIIMMFTKLILHHRKGGGEEMII